MRRQLTLAAVALTSMVVLAVLVPFAALVRTLAEDRAVSNAEKRAETLVPVLATQREKSEAAAVVDSLNANRDNAVTVFLEDGSHLGADAVPGPGVELARRRATSFSTPTENGHEVLIPVRLPDNSVAVVRVFVPDATLHDGVVASWAVLAGLGVGLVLVAAFVADRLARLLSAPVLDLAATAEALSSGHLDARVSPAGPREVVEVGQTLNRLADRIGELVTAEREAIADLSHRLRTPITALRLDIDGLPPGPERERLERDADNLARAVDRLIAEARRPVRTELGSTADLAAAVRDRTEFWAPLAEEQGRPFTVTLPDAACPVAVLRDDLAAAVDALIGNVFAHTDEGTGYRVRVALDEVGPADRGGHAGPVLEIEDDGRGLPAGTDVLARGTSGGGSTGLGLDIVRRTAESTGGSVVVGHSPSGGARITVRFGPGR